MKRICINVTKLDIRYAPRKGDKQDYTCPIARACHRHGELREAAVGHLHMRCKPLEAATALADRLAKDGACYRHLLRKAIEQRDEARKALAARKLVP